VVRSEFILWKERIFAEFDIRDRRSRINCGHCRPFKVNMRGISDLQLIVKLSSLKAQGSRWNRQIHWSASCSYSGLLPSGMQALGGKASLRQVYLWWLSSGLRSTLPDATFLWWVASQKGRSMLSWLCSHANICALCKGGWLVEYIQNRI
jgi:hypothetical protein